MDNQKENKVKKVKMSVKLGWSSLTISSAISQSLLAFFTLYASDVIGLDTGIVGSLLKLVDASNLWLVFACACLSGVGFTTFYGFASTMVIDCMDYGEYKTGKRVEGVMGGVQSFMCKIGTGLGGAIAGVLLSMSGYVGTAETQTSGAMNMIIALASVIPALFFVIFLLVYKKYDLEQRLPEIHTELEKRRGNA